MLPGSGKVQASGPVKEDTVIGPKIAAVERRKARLPVTRQAGAFVRGQCDLRRSGAPPPSGEANKTGRKPGNRTGRTESPQALAARSADECALFKPHGARRHARVPVKTVQATGRT